MKSKITAVTTIVLVLLLTSAALLCGVWFFRAAWYGEAELLSEEPAGNSPQLGSTVNLHTRCDLPWGQTIKSAVWQGGDGVFQAGDIKIQTKKISTQGSQQLITVPLKSSRSGKVDAGTLTVNIQRPFFKDKVRKKSFTVKQADFTVEPLKIDDKNQLPLADELTPVPPEKDIIRYIAGAVILLLLAAAVWFILRRYCKRRAKPLPPWEIARQELMELRRAAADRPLAWCIAQLTDVVRSYLTQRFNYPAITQTTEEFFTTLRKQNSQLTGEQIRYLEDFLSAADLVKFANLRPEKDMFENAAVKAEKLIDETGIPDSVSDSGNQ